MMAAELIDSRAKVTIEAHCALSAEARMQGVDRSEIIRDVLHSWALKRIHGATLLGNCLRAKGLTGAAEGLAGAVEGTSGNGGAGLEWE